MNCQPSDANRFTILSTTISEQRKSEPAYFCQPENGDESSTDLPLWQEAHDYSRNEGILQDGFIGSIQIFGDVELSHLILCIDSIKFRQDLTHAH